MGLPSIVVDASVSVLAEYRTIYSSELDIEASMDGKWVRREILQGDLDGARKELLQEMRYRGESTGPTERTNATSVKSSDDSEVGRQRAVNTVDELAGQDRIQAADETIGMRGRFLFRGSEGGSGGHTGDGAEVMYRLKDEHCIDDMYA